MVSLIAKVNAKVNARCERNFVESLYLCKPLVDLVLQSPVPILIRRLNNPGLVSSIVHFNPLWFAQLIDSGASPNSHHNGFSALMATCNNTCPHANMMYSKETVQFLLNLGANPNLSTDNGVSPLMIASFRGNLDVINLLISHGSDINAVDKHGHNAHDYARFGRLHNGYLTRTSIFDTVLKTPPVALFDTEDDGGENDNLRVYNEIMKMFHGLPALSRMDQHHDYSVCNSSSHRYDKKKNFGWCCIYNNKD